MNVTPNGASEYHNGHEVGRYGRAENDAVFVWYHSGIRGQDEPMWAMDTDVEWKISVSVDTILVVATDGPDASVYAVERDAFTESVKTMDGRRQCAAHASDEFVHEVGDPNDHLNGDLWITADNGHGSYHVDSNEA